MSARKRLRRASRFLRTPKGLMLLILVGLLVLAVPSTAGNTVPLLTAGALTAAVLDVLIVFALDGEWGFPSGALLTGLFIGALIDPFDRIEVVFVAAVAGIFAKHLLRLGGSHVFNPAALALVVSSVAFDSGQSWWGALPGLGSAGLGVVCVSGFYIARRINKLPMVVAFLALYFALFSIDAVSNPASVAEVFRSPDLQAALFFAFFMLDDPPTSPVHYRDQVWFGALVAIASYVVFTRFGVVYFLLAGLLVGNVAEAIRRVVAKHGRRLRRRHTRPRSPAYVPLETPGR
jgi:Na+-translocating ferredoxin:NAD+ oxidoreductase RnfD subunit